MNFNSYFETSSTCSLCDNWSCIKFVILYFIDASTVLDHIMTVPMDNALKFSAV